MSQRPNIRYFKSLPLGVVGGALCYKYCGKEQDEETGLYYYGARYYLPWICRFSSVDLKALKYNWQGSYCYAENNPVKFVDVNGEGTNDEVQGSLKPNQFINPKGEVVTLEGKWKTSTNMEDGQATLKGGDKVDVKKGQVNSFSINGVKYNSTYEKGKDGKWGFIGYRNKAGEFYGKETGSKTVSATEQNVGANTNAPSDNGVLQAYAKQLGAFGEAAEKFTIGTIHVMSVFGVGSVAGGLIGSLGKFGEMAIYRMSLETAAQMAVQGGNYKKLDVGDIALSSFASQPVSILAGSLIDYKPFETNKNQLSLLGYNKSISSTMVDLTTKFAVSQFALGKLTKPVFGQLGAPQLEPILQMPITFGVKLAGAKIKEQIK